MYIKKKSINCKMIHSTKSLQRRRKFKIFKYSVVERDPYIKAVGTKYVIAHLLNMHADLVYNNNMEFNKTLQI